MVTRIVIIIKIVILSLRASWAVPLESSPFAAQGILSIWVRKLRVSPNRNLSFSFIISLGPRMSLSLSPSFSLSLSLSFSQSFSSSCSSSLSLRRLMITMEKERAQ